MNAVERRRMAEHEAMMRRPPRELFPDIGKPGKERKGICKGCKQEFVGNRRGGPNQKWCSSKCRIRTQRGYYK